MIAFLAPVERVTGYDVVMPLPRLEREYMPSVARILKACRRALAWK
jgi:pyruvate dehydrogenase E1 component beta subunit